MLPTKAEREEILKIAKIEKEKKEKIEAEKLRKETLKKNKEEKKKKIEKLKIWRKRIDDKVLEAMKRAEKETYVVLKKCYNGGDIDTDDELQSLINYCKKAGYEAYESSEGYNDVCYETGHESWVSFPVLRIKWAEDQNS